MLMCSWKGKSLKSSEEKCDSFIISVKALKINHMLRGSPYSNTNAILNDRIWYCEYGFFSVGFKMSIYIYADKFNCLTLDSD